MDTNLSLNLGYTPNCKTPAHIFCDISCLTIILCIYLRAFQFLLNLILLLQGSQQISPANSSPVSFENNKLITKYIYGICSIYYIVTIRYYLLVNFTSLFAKLVFTQYTAVNLLIQTNPAATTATRA